MSIINQLTKTMLGLALGLSLNTLQAATITIVNGDGNLEGLNDPTPILSAETGVSTTLGALRLRVLRHAAAIWGRNLGGNVEIKVLAKFDPLTCSANGAVLGQAGTLQLVANFPNAPYTNTAYPIALANTLAGRDLNGATAEIRRLEQELDRAHTPIVALTAHAMADDRRRCIEAGMDDFLPKPVDPDLMFSMLLRWLRARKA